MKRKKINQAFLNVTHLYDFFLLEVLRVQVCFLFVFPVTLKLNTYQPVSRTCTAPFDRLKVFLITRPPDLGGVQVARTTSIGGVKITANAIARIYTEGGILAFWTGNGLSVAKIFPESAIKFFAYESAASRDRLHFRACVNPSCFRNARLLNMWIMSMIQGKLAVSAGFFLAASEGLAVN